jgi:hypothetical protein
VTVDTAPPPETSITVHPAATTTSTGATFSLASSDNKVTFLCRLDGGPFAACKSKMSYAGLAHMSHTVEVEARDAAGNVDPTPASFTWTIS